MQLRRLAVGACLGLAPHSSAHKAAAPCQHAFLSPAPCPPQLEASIEFLRSAHPLTHVAPDKKSRVQQVGRVLWFCMRAWRLACALPGAACRRAPCAPLQRTSNGISSCCPQAICDMLAGVLQPLADHGDPRRAGFPHSAAMQLSVPPAILLLHNPVFDAAVASAVR